LAPFHFFLVLSVNTESKGTSNKMTGLDGKTLSSNTDMQTQEIQIKFIDVFVIRASVTMPFLSYNHILLLHQIHPYKIEHTWYIFYIYTSWSLLHIYYSTIQILLLLKPSRSGTDRKLLLLRFIKWLSSVKCGE
jgi:hypothetical protein